MVYSTYSHVKPVTFTFTRYWVNLTLKAFRHSFMLKSMLLTKWGPWYVKLFCLETSLWLDCMGCPVTIARVLHPVSVLWVLDGLIDIFGTLFGEIWTSLHKCATLRLINDHHCFLKPYRSCHIGIFIRQTQNEYWHLHNNYTLHSKCLWKNVRVQILSIYNFLMACWRVGGLRFLMRNCLCWHQVRLEVKLSIEVPSWGFTVWGEYIWMSLLVCQSSPPMCSFWCLQSRIR